MKLKLLSLAAVLGSTLLAAPVQAREFADIYTDCGLGAMIAPNNGAVAAVTNVTFDLGTTAVSSNVSSEDSCSGGKKKTAAYIFQQHAQIEKDVAKGNGQHLAALMDVARCNAGSAQMLRSNLADVVSRPGYATQTRYGKAEALYQEVGKSACQLG
jgi:Protein of unknown function (DUF3015)